MEDTRQWPDAKAVVQVSRLLGEQHGGAATQAPKALLTQALAHLAYGDLRVFSPSDTEMVRRLIGSMASNAEKYGIPIFDQTEL